MRILKSDKKCIDGKTRKSYGIIVPYRRDVNEFFAQLNKYLDVTEEKIVSIEINVNVK